MLTKNSLIAWLIFTGLLSFGGWNACSRAYEQFKPPELIEFITIPSGKSTTIYLDEVFYARKYRPVFNPNASIQLVYQADSNKVILTPIESFAGLSLIEFSNDDDNYVLPVIVKAKIPVLFSHKPLKVPQQIFVMGNFNNWNRTSLPMSDDDGDGVYTREVLLDDGAYEYQFVIDKTEIFDPANPLKVDNGFGYFNSVVHVEAPYAGSIINLYYTPMTKRDTLTLALDVTADSTNCKLVALLDNQLYPAEYYKITNNRVAVDLQPLQNDPALHVLRLTMTYKFQPGNVVTVWLKKGAPLENKHFIWNDALIYAIMIDRFVNGDRRNDRPIVHPELDQRANFQGGDFAGLNRIIASGYFDTLGVNTLWLSPVNQTTDSAYREWPEPHRFFSGYHGYWPVHEKRTEPRFGTVDEFKKLVQTAHKHNLLVLLDFISNHVHREHHFFREHRDWFGQLELPDGSLNIRRWDEYRLTTWFDTFIPSFDFERSDAAVEVMTDNAIWWLKKAGLDGFRHDAVKHVPPKFWKTLTRKIKTRLNPHREINLYQIGETFGSNDLIKSYVNNGMLESQFNFNQFFTARRVFVEASGDFRDLQLSQKKALEVFGYNHLMGNIMDSHDQVRMLAFFDGDLTLADNGTERAWREPPITVDQPTAYQKALVYLGYLLTVPGVPVINYGDEFGMTGANDPDNRRMMRFGTQLSSAEQAQLVRVTELTRLRARFPALRRGDFLTLWCEKDIFIYSRGDAFDRLIVALNKSSQERFLEITLPDWFNAQSLHGLNEARRPMLNAGNCRFELPAYSVQIWKVQ